MKSVNFLVSQSSLVSADEYWEYGHIEIKDAEELKLS